MPFKMPKPSDSPHEESGSFRKVIGSIIRHAREKDITVGEVWDELFAYAARRQEEMRHLAQEAIDGDRVTMTAAAESALKESNADRIELVSRHLNILRYARDIGRFRSATSHSIFSGQEIVIVSSNFNDEQITIMLADEFDGQPL